MARETATDDADEEYERLAYGLAFTYGTYVDGIVISTRGHDVSERLDGGA